MRVRVSLRPPAFELETGRDPLYERAARKKITELLAENRRLRHGKQPRTPALWRTVERLFVAWLDRRYPSPRDTEPSYGDIEVIEP